MPVPGVVIARLEGTSVRDLIDALIYIAEAARPEDWQSLQFIPDRKDR